MVVVDSVVTTGVALEIGVTVSAGERKIVGVGVDVSDVNVDGIAVSVIKAIMVVEVSAEARVGLGRIQGTSGKMVGKVTTIVVIIVAIFS